MGLEIIKKAIIDLKELDLKNEHAYEQVIWKFLTCVQLPSMVITIPKGNIIYRTRTHTTEDYFNNILDIGITPKKFIASFGRCNRPAQSVFYASENRQTSYAELIESWSKGKNTGDCISVTIGRWKLKDDIDVIVIPSVDKSDQVSEYDKVYGEILKEYLLTFDEYTRSSFVETYNYLFEIFRKSSNGNNLNYILTAAVSNILLMHPESKSDGIFYPSVPFGLQGVNFAITEKYAIEKLELVGALRNRFEIIDFNEDGQPIFKEREAIEAKRIERDNGLIIW